MTTFLVMAACSFSGGSNPAGEVDAASDQDPDASEPVDAPAGATLIARINVGGPTHTGVDFFGEWSADGGECDGSQQTIAGDVQNTVDDPLFNSWRFGRPNTCTLAVESGDYRVKMLFAEIFRGGCDSGTDTRIFTITIEGANVLTLDVMDDDHGRGCVLNTRTPMARPFAETFDVAVADGQLDIAMGLGGEDNGVLSALEVLQLP